MSSLILFGELEMEKWFSSLTWHTYPDLLQDADGSVPFVWGTDADGNLVFSDETEIVTKSCGKSYAPFPKGNNKTCGHCIRPLCFTPLKIVQLY